jgi:predicted metal-dependent phosphotriesterase family hydrolase
MIARTVLGAVPVDELGVVDSHDHLFLATPALPGHAMTAPHRADAEVAAFAAAGGRTIVSWTPRGLGRRRQQTAALSRAQGVHVLCATGRHRALLYDAGHPLLGLDADALAELFVDDVVHGGCGLIKVGSGYWNLDAHERTNLAAAAAAHLATGAPIAVHLELGTAADLVLESLREHGVDPRHVVLGHLGRNPDPYYLADTAARGAYLCLDGPSTGNHRTDWRLLPLLEELAGAGHGAQLLLGGDTTSCCARADRGGPGMAALLVRTTASIRRHLGAGLASAMTVTNPAAAWGVPA